MTTLSHLAVRAASPIAMAIAFLGLALACPTGSMAEAAPKPTAASPKAPAVPSAPLLASDGLPRGIKAVLVGDRDEGIWSCRVRNALPEPFTLSTGTTEFTWIVQVDALVLKDFKAEFDGPVAKEERTQEDCNDNPLQSVCDKKKDKSCPTHYGATMKRVGKQAFPPGIYTLRVSAGGKFIVKEIRIE
ncbi:MAG: hypothetical protein WAM82_02365 [Thermoanaerobaculia bacterium]